MDEKRVVGRLVPGSHARVELGAVLDVVSQPGDGGAEHVPVHLADPRARVLLGDEHVAGAAEGPVHARVLPDPFGVLEPQRRGFPQILRPEDLPTANLREARSRVLVDEHARHLVIDALEVAVIPRGDEPGVGAEALAHGEGLADDHVGVELDDPLAVGGVVLGPVEDAAGKVVRGVVIARVDGVVRRGEVSGHDVAVEVVVLGARQDSGETTGGPRADPAVVQRDGLPVHVRLAVGGEDVVVVVHLAIVERRPKCATGPAERLAGGPRDARAREVGIGVGFSGGRGRDQQRGEHGESREDAHSPGVAARAHRTILARARRGGLVPSTDVYRRVSRALVCRCRPRRAESDIDEVVVACRATTNKRQS